VPKAERTNASSHDNGLFQNAIYDNHKSVVRRSSKQPVSKKLSQEIQDLQEELARQQDELE
jgi:hypothetical protein